eukprot:3239503-Amphidinium_carterae.1
MRVLAARINNSLNSDCTLESVLGRFWDELRTSFGGNRGFCKAFSSPTMQEVWGSRDIFPLPEVGDQVFGGDHITGTKELHGQTEPIRGEVFDIEDKQVLGQLVFGSEDVHREDQKEVHRFLSSGRQPVQRDCATLLVDGIITGLNYLHGPSFLGA